MKRYVRIISLPLALALLVLAAAGCNGASSPTSTSAPAAAAAEGTGATIELGSVFAPGEPIPPKYSCDGEDISPPLQWSDVPEGTQSFALIVDDPDAPGGNWVHWVLYNLPLDTRSLPESVPGDAELPDGSWHGNNSWGRSGYGGPCPPGGTHRYFFKLYALDTTLDLEPGQTKDRLLQAMEGHILAQGELMGTYTK